MRRPCWPSCCPQSPDGVRNFLIDRGIASDRAEIFLRETQSPRSADGFPSSKPWSTS